MSKFLFVDSKGEHEFETINDFVKDFDSFDGIMKAIARDEESLLKLKEYKRFQNDYAMFKLAEYYYNEYSNLMKDCKKYEEDIKRLKEKIEDLKVKYSESKTEVTTTTTTTTTTKAPESKPIKPMYERDQYFSFDELDKFSGNMTI